MMKCKHKFIQEDGDLYPRCEYCHLSEKDAALVDTIKPCIKCGKTPDYDDYRGCILCDCGFYCDIEFFADLTEMINWWNKQTYVDELLNKIERLKSIDIKAIAEKAFFQITGCENFRDGNILLSDLLQKLYDGAVSEIDK